jgi:hypothetical protein
MKHNRLLKKLTILLALGFISLQGIAQLPDDAIMLGKKQLCTGFTYMHSQWNDYWEGTLKRNNQNIGTLSTQTLAFMGSYGISNRLLVITSVPYVWTHASAGTLSGLAGFQDFEVYLKWEAFSKKIGKNTISLFAVGGFTTPITDYENDFQPMSIGLGSTNLTGRLTADYQRGLFFVTLSGAYVYRNNVKIDRTSYYTTEIHYTNEVEMPDVFNSNLNIGLRKQNFIAEAVLMNMHTLGGFDIRRNDMPFVSNRMNSTSIGVHGKYFIPWVTNLEVIGGYDYVINGKDIGLPQSRNVGKSQTFTIGVYYILGL